MNPGKPLARRARLQSRTELRRGAPLRAVSPKRAAKMATGRPVLSTLTTRVRPAVPAKVRKALTVRSGGLCEIQLPGCTGTAVDPSHRKKTGTGGRHGEAKVAHDVLSNLLHACRADHDELHRRPAWAKHPARGWMLDEGQHPAAVPALYRGGLALLADDGRVLRLSEVAA